MVNKSPNFKNFRSSSDKASRHLSKIKSSDTKAEVLLRSALWKLGFRFRKHVKDLPGKPDIVFSREHLVVFCDGDFWHGKKWGIDKQRLKKGPNAPYWISKIQANIDRDKRYNRELVQLGWTVIRLWESDVLADPIEAATLVAEAVVSKRRTQNK